MGKSTVKEEASGRTLALVVIGGITATAALGHMIGITMTTGLDGPMVQGDARSYFAYLPSIVLDGDLDLTDQFRVLQPEPGADDPGYPFGVGADGRASNPFPVGPALVWLPGYAVGLTVDRLLAGVGVMTSAQPFGYGVGSVWGAALISIFAAGGAAFLGYRVARRVAGPLPALAAAVFVWLGTPALYYTIVAPLYSHAVAWFAAALMLWAVDLTIDSGSGRGADGDRETWNQEAAGASAPRPSTGRPLAWFAVGMAGGLLVAIRLQELPLLAIPAAVLLAAVLRTGGEAGSGGGESSISRGRGRVFSSLAIRDLVTRGLALGGGLFLGFLPQALTSHHLHGEWLPWTHAARSGDASLGKLFELLFAASSEHEGWISWSPVVVLGLAGLLFVALRSRHRAIRALGWGGLVATFGLIAIDLIHPYGAGASFGGRRYLSLTPLLAVGIAALGSSPGAARGPGFRSDPGIGLRSSAARTAFWIVAGLLVVWELWLLLCYELMVVMEGTYPTLSQLVRYALGGGVS